MLTHLTPQINIQQSERLQALYHMAVELSAIHSLESVLDVALQHCLALTDSQFGFVGLNTPDGKAMDVAAMQGFFPDDKFYEHYHLIPLRPNIFARAVLENRPVRSDDARTDPGRVGQPKGHPPVRTFLGVPLRIQDQPIGMIGVANRPDLYDDEHEQLLMTYAAQVAIVIQNAQLYEQLAGAKEELENKVVDRTQQLQVAKEALGRKARQLHNLLTKTVDVQERERQRIAQDMHDGVNQLLVGAMLETKSARQRIVNGNPDQADASLEAVQDILHRVEAEIRRVVHDLHPPILDELGVVPALRRYAERFEQYTGLPCGVKAVGEATRLPSKYEIGVYRLMQEALQNVSVHAQATRVDVIISFAPKIVKLTVIDDGCGFDLATVEQNSSGHFGLLSMSERAESMGGQLSIITKPKQGTRIELTVPIRPANGQNGANRRG